MEALKILQQDKNAIIAEINKNIKKHPGYMQILAKNSKVAYCHLSSILNKKVELLPSYFVRIYRGKELTDNEMRKILEEREELRQKGAKEIMQISAETGISKYYLAYCFSGKKQISNKLHNILKKYFDKTKK